MEASQSPRHLLKESLGSISSKTAILICGLFDLILVSVDGIYNFILPEVTLLDYLILFTFMAILVGHRLAYPNPSKIALALRHLYLHLWMIYGLSFVAPVNSPYLLFIIGVVLGVYFDFGIKAVVLSMSSLGLALSAQFFWRDEINREQFGAFVFYYLLICVLMFYLLTFLQITAAERKALEAVTNQIELERKRLLALVNNLNDAVIACDEKFEVVLSNPKAQDLLNIDHSIKSRKLDNLMDLRDAEGKPMHLSRLADENKRLTVHTAYRLYYADNDYVNLYIAITRISRGHAIEGYVVLLRDITKLKNLDEERKEFVSIMSHELRTPVSVVEGGISLAKDFSERGAYDKAMEYLGKAHEQSLMLAAIVDSLSTLVNIERTQEEVKVGEINARSVVENVLTNYQVEAEAKGLKLSTDYHPATRTIYTNEASLYEILQNLIANAVKYTKKGHVKITVRPHNKTHVAFEVSDTGIGISKSDQGHIFEKFWRSEDFLTRKSGGTGLGLYLTKKLADSIGAKIEVQSTVGKGSTFTLLVPIYDAQEI